jgi:Fe-S cluster assembly ATP-binding protein
VKAESDLGALIITHYQRILHLIKPDRVSILVDGRIVKEGGPELVEQIEPEGYTAIRAAAVAAGADVTTVV